MHPTIPEDVKLLLTDFESFISDILKGENLSKKAKDKKEYLIKKIKDIKSNYPQEFQDKGDSLEQGEEYEGLLPEALDNISLPSERGDKDEDAAADGVDSGFGRVSKQQNRQILRGSPTPPKLIKMFK